MFFNGPMLWKKWFMSWQMTKQSFMNNIQLNRKANYLEKLPPSHQWAGTHPHFVQCPGT